MSKSTLTTGLVAIVALVAGLLAARAFLTAAAKTPATKQTTIFPTPRQIPELDLLGTEDGRCGQQRLGIKDFHGLCDVELGSFLHLSPIPNSATSFYKKRFLC